ncbi:nucleotide-binding alpha-beta plait domain-containing protein [Tanacetum coccineum]
MVMSGSQRTKEDDVQKISTSVFVTNLPDGYGAKDLWNTCKLYGHVVDTYIPVRRSKAGKRFGFVRFIKVLDVDRLVNNLCTVWVGHNRIHANVARFQRELLNKQSQKGNDKGPNVSGYGGTKNGEGTKSTTNSYAYVVKGNTSKKEVMEDRPTMVLDDSCLNQDDFSLCLLGKVKEFASLTNLKVVLGKEGFANFVLKYMGGLWVMIVFQDEDTKNRFQFNLAVGSWFSQIIQAHHDFVIDERFMWMEVEGVPCKWWSRNTFSRIASRWGTLLNGEELEEDGYHSNRICISTKLKTALMESFKMVYRGKMYWVRVVEVPGWVPDFEEENEEESDVNDGLHDDEEQGDVSGNFNDGVGDSDGEEIPKTNFEEVPDKHISDDSSIRHGDVQSEDPFGFTPKDVSFESVVRPDILSEENRYSNDKEDGGVVGIQGQEMMGDSNDNNEFTCSGKKSLDHKE